MTHVPASERFEKSFACSNQVPWVSQSDPNLAFGFASFHFAFGGEARSCCSCIELTYQHEQLAGKRMVVQVRV